MVSRKAVREMRPERDEIIVCTGVKPAQSGVQRFGHTQATGLPASATRADRRRPSCRARTPRRSGSALASGGTTAGVPYRDSAFGAAAFITGPASRLRRLREEKARRRPGTPHQSQRAGKALRQPRSRTVPPCRPRLRRAPPPSPAQRGALYFARLPPALRQCVGLQALSGGTASIRTRALFRTPRCRPLHALLSAGSRGPFALRPLRHAGGGARLARTKECRRREQVHHEAVLRTVLQANRRLHYRMHKRLNSVGTVRPLPAARQQIQPLRCFWPRSHPRGADGITLTTRALEIR